MLLYEDHRTSDHKSVVYALAYSADGETLASGSRDGTLVLRDAAGGLHTLIPREATSLPVHAVAFAPDGTVVVGGAFGWHGYRQHATGDWRVVGSMMTTPATAVSVLDDRTIAIGTGDRAKPSVGGFELWDLATGRRREPHFLEPNGVRAVAACPAKRTVAWATGHKKVCVWEVIKPNPYDFPQPKNCTSVALGPDGTLLAAAVDYAARVYDLAKRREKFELKGHKGQVGVVAISPDGETIATGSWDRTVKVWDATTGRERATFEWDIGRVFSLTYAPDGLRLAAGGDEGRVMVWDLE